MEPYLVGGHLLFGVMTWSMKAHDLLRDPRCVLHSAVSDPDASEGELKLYGRAVQIQDQAHREGPRGAWWVGRPPADACVFSLAIEQAVFLTWDPKGGTMTARRWSQELGVREARRSYP